MAFVGCAGGRGHRVRLFIETAAVGIVAPRSDVRAGRVCAAPPRNDKQKQSPSDGIAAFRALLRSYALGVGDLRVIGLSAPQSFRRAVSSARRAFLDSLSRGMNCSIAERLLLL